MREFSRLFFPIILLTIAVGVSCNKTEETTTSLYMTGPLKSNIPSHLISGTSFELIASGITLPVDSLSYKWTTTGFNVDSLIGTSGTIIVPDSVGLYDITIRVTHPRYTASQLSKTVIVFNPNSEESYSGVVKGNEYITDSRDGQKYYFSTIGNTDWFNTNLNWDGKGITLIGVSAGMPYNNVDALAVIFGRLYTWTEITQNICPQGWRVPSNEDWEELAKNANGGVSLPFDSNWPKIGERLSVTAKLNSENIWKYSPNSTKSNLFNWNALPGGNSLNSLRNYININQYGMWWSATEKDSKNAYYRYIHFDSPDFPYSYAGKSTFGASVRCVRNSDN